MSRFAVSLSWGGPTSAFDDVDDWLGRRPHHMSSSLSSPRGFQAARERERGDATTTTTTRVDAFLRHTDAGRYLSSFLFASSSDDGSVWTDERWRWILNAILKCAATVFVLTMVLFFLAVVEKEKKTSEGEVVAVERASSSRQEEEEEEEEDDARKATEEEIKDVTTVENMRNMSEEELRVLELSVKMRDVLSKEKSNALCEARLSVERKQLAAKLAGLDLKKESNETTKQTNDMKRESLEFKMKLNRDKVFREDVADALRTGLVVVCGALVYYGWNVIRDAWLNESEICYSASYAAASFSLVPSNLGVLFSAFTNRLEKLWCVSKTFAKALFTSIASLYCSKLVVKFGLLSSTNSTVSPLSSIALTVGVGGGYLGYKFVRYLRGDETKFLYLWSFYVLSVFAANESADYIGREVLQSTLRRILFRVTLGLAFPLIIASGSFR